ncbi:MAG: mechanosensitive ion channel family protein [Planctomycetes bacterium]|nr:mechanosensitive ion channel family protein [Planctomycetota bacterium]
MLRAFGWIVACALALAPALSAQAVSADVPIDELSSRLEGLDASQLAQRAEEWKAAVEQAVVDRDKAAEALADAAEGDRPAAQEAYGKARDALAELSSRFALVVNALSDAGGDVTDLRVLLLEVRGVDVGNLDARAMASLAEKWVTQGKDWLIENAPGMIVRAVAFVLILLVFRVLSGFSGGIVRRVVGGQRVKMSDLLRTFFVNTVRKVVFLLGLLFALKAISVDLTPILTGIGVLGFVVGFAMQDTLSNFAAGIMVLMYRPYDIGDVVNAGGVTGKVTAMSLVSTTLTTPDNQSVIVPNGKIWGGTITNVTANPTRRVDMTIGIGYGDDVDKAEAVLLELVKAHPKVLAEPAPVIKLGSLGESSVDLLVRPWCKTSDYWDVLWDLTKAIKLRFDEDGISIPFPQRDLHLVDVPERLLKA